MKTAWNPTHTPRKVGEPRKKDRRFRADPIIAIWCRLEESNLQPTVYDTVALPIELSRREKKYTPEGRNQQDGKKWPATNSSNGKVIAENRIIADLGHEIAYSTWPPPILLAIAQKPRSLKHIDRIAAMQTQDFRAPSSAKPLLPTIFFDMD